MEKIKITEKQLRFLQEQKMENNFHMDQDGQLQQGDMETPDPHTMAEKVIADMRLHTEYMKDEEMARQFADAFYEVLSEKISSGEFFDLKRPNRLKADDIQMNEDEPEIEEIEEEEEIELNEGIKQLKADFKKFL